MLRGKSKYNIGEVSNISQLSVKALRYYDAKGILVPAIRDAQTNYRYYSEPQILRALTISALRNRGFSLMEMDQILNTTSLESVTEFFDLHTREIQREINRLENELALVDESREMIINALKKTRFDNEQATHKPRDRNITVYKMKKQSCVFTRRRSRIFVEEVFWDRFIELQEIIAQKKYTPAGPITGVFHEHYTHQFFFDEGDLEVLQPVMGKPAGEQVKDFGGFLVASLVHVGFYNELLTEYIALVKWIEAGGYQICGDPIEEYLVEYTQGVAPAGYVTRINFPIRKAGEK
jgi:DNA-binding transcriptional MerR regulator/effector-binding domain-containing protein